MMGMDGWGRDRDRVYVRMCVCVRLCDFEREKRVRMKEVAERDGESESGDCG